MTETPTSRYTIFWNLTQIFRVLHFPAGRPRRAPVHRGWETCWSNWRQNYSAFSVTVQQYRSKPHSLCGVAIQQDHTHITRTISRTWQRRSKSVIQRVIDNAIAIVQETASLHCSWWRTFQTCNLLDVLTIDDGDTVLKCDHMKWTSTRGTGVDRQKWTWGRKKKHQNFVDVFYGWPHSSPLVWIRIRVTKSGSEHGLRPGLRPGCMALSLQEKSVLYNMARQVWTVKYELNPDWQVTADCIRQTDTQSL